MVAFDGGREAGGGDVAGPATAAAPTQGAVANRHGFETLTVADVVEETDEAASFVLAVPAALEEKFRYRAGQFVTLRVSAGGERHLRSYSMSSSPDLGEPLQITVKRTAGGVVSNLLLDTVGPGSDLEVSPPGGAFVLDYGPGDIVAFAAGSGITPVFSIMKTALVTTDRQVRLLYANRGRSAAIFAAALDEWAARHPGRARVVHHYDDVSGLVDGGVVADFVGPGVGAQFYLCGPEPFMNTVEATLLWKSFRRHQIHKESFTPDQDDGRRTAPVVGTIRVTLDGRTVDVAARAGSTILQSVRRGGVIAPSSCESGTCATCLARVVEGRAEMRRNEVLTPEEIAAGMVLTCQAVPRTASTVVVYE